MKDVIEISLSFLLILLIVLIFTVYDNGRYCLSLSSDGVGHTYCIGKPR